ncbi:MAG TPA: lamin tail domain-containing protein, partial [Tepidisphaeraceae bacterium]|nr:lamin tail domain-containing protein [Tepidisphaeraceae bacterium]
MLRGLWKQAKKAIGSTPRVHRTATLRQAVGALDRGWTRPWVEGMEPRLLLAAADPIISEFMALNTKGLMDQDGDYSDWIEIHNPGDTAINLDGWYLTDTVDTLAKWRLPAVTLDANGYLVVFASGKDRAVVGQELHTDFKLSGDGEYLGLVKPDGTTVVSSFDPAFLPQENNISYGISQGSATEVTFLTQGTQGKALLPSSGALPDFTSINADETGWTSGAMGVGFDNNSDYLSLIGLNTKTMPGFGTTASVLIRVPFTVDDPSKLGGLKLRMKYEDGFVAYLNGQRVASDNAPDTLAWNSRTVNGVNRDEWQAVRWTEFDISNYLDKLVPGKNVLAIQGLNSSTSSSDLVIVPELVGVKLAEGTEQAGYLTTPTPGRANMSQVLNLGPLISEVTHSPSTPNSTNTVYDADDLIVTAKVAAWKNPVNTVTLKYRVMYRSEMSLSMLDDGQHGDGAAGDGVYGAIIPASASSAGEMVRYYVVATDSEDQMSRAPLFASPTGSPEYFGTVIADPSVTSQLPIFQWFVENPSAATTDNGTKASVYYLGQFYDNVHVRIRGGTARGWEKPHFKFDFNAGYHFQYDVNQPRVEEFNLNSIYSDKSAMRTILSWETYRDAGSPYCTAFPMRIQQNGDFYSVAIFVEQPDEDYLVRQGMDPDGAMYKLTTDVPGASFSSDPNWVVSQFEKRLGDPDDKSDLLSLVNAIGYGQRLTGDTREQYLRQYLFDNFDVAQAINSWAVNTIIHDTDDAQKNYYLYRDPSTGLWRMLPWDKDLTFGRNFDGGAVLNDNLWAAHDPQSHPLFGDSEHPKIDGSHAWNAIIDALLDVPEIKEMYLRRLRELMDQFLQAPGTPAAERYYDKRIDALYAMMAPDMALDNAKWGQWGTYQTFATGVNALKNQYLEPRRKHLYNDHSLNTSYPDYAGIPAANTGTPTINFGAIDFNPVSGNQNEEYIELVNPSGSAVDLSGWTLSGGVEFTFAAGTVIPANGKLYVAANIPAFRARTSGPGGGQGLIVVGGYKNQLSAWGETLVLQDEAGNTVQSYAYPGNPTAAQQGLRITEVMYNPAAGSEAAWDKDEYEFIELQNISDQPLNLAGVQFTAGIDFVFGNMTLEPGQYVVVVKNQAAFESRYGVGTANIAGVYATKYLNNAGDTIQLKDASGEEILEFHYDAAWYASTDGGGQSLVIVDPAAPIASWQTPEGWRASTQVGGSPGQDDPEPDYVLPTVSITPVAPDPQEEAVNSIEIVFSEPITGLDLADLSLSFNGGPNLLTAAQTLSTTDNIIWTLGNLAGLINLTGVYVLTLVAGGSGIADLSGNELNTGASESFAVSLDGVAPTAEIIDVSPDPRNTGVESITIRFSEPVSGVNVSDFVLRLNDGYNRLSNAQSLSMVDSVTWTLNGLSGLTSESGQYTLTLVAEGSGIIDEAGNALAGDASESFSVDAVAPTAGIVVTPATDQSSIDSVTITFSEPVTGFGLSDLRLSRDGGDNLLSDAQTLSSADGLTWTLGNLAGVAGRLGSYVLTLNGAGSDITDAAGNPLAADVAGSGVVSRMQQAGAVRLQRSASEANLMEVYVGGSATPEYSVAFAALPQIHIVGQSDADQLTLDFSNGNMLPAGGIAFDGAGGNDSLKIVSSRDENLLVNNAGITVGTTPITSANVEDMGWEVAAGSSLTLGGSVAVSLDVATTLGSLTLTDSAKLSLVAGSNAVLKLGALSIGANATLDLADNDLIVSATAETRAAVLA